MGEARSTRWRFLSGLTEIPIPALSSAPPEAAVQAGSALAAELRRHSYAVLVDQVRSLRHFGQRRSNRTHDQTAPAPVAFPSPSPGLVASPSLRRSSGSLP